MEECSGEEKVPTGSVTGSWIQLDEKNGKSSSEESPQYSDEENMTDALADASRSLYNSTIKADNGQALNQTPAEPSITPQKSECRSNVLYISTLLLSHSVALLVGVLIGRKVSTR